MDVTEVNDWLLHSEAEAVQTLKLAKKIETKVKSLQSMQKHIRRFKDLMQANLWLIGLADAAQMSKLAKKMEGKANSTKSMQKDIRRFKSKLEILLARFERALLQNDRAADRALLQNGTPVAACGASAEPLSTGAAPAELLSTRAEPCARS